MGLKERVDAAIDAALGERVVGCVVLINEGGRPVYVRAAGYADREAGRTVRENSIFRLASVTKPIVATTALRMIDLGLLRLDDPVTKYLPWFTPRAPDGTSPDILIRHLLTHTSGLTYDRPPDVSSGADPGPLIPLEENLKRYVRQPLAFAPGTAWHYGMSIDVLGGVLAAINRSDLEGAVAKYVTGPLGMTHTHFGVSEGPRLAVPYGDGKPTPFRMAEPQAMPNDDGSFDHYSPKRIFQHDAPQSGGSGMAGPAGDLMKMLEAVRGDFLAPATRDAALANQIADLPRDDAGQRFGYLGAVIADPKVSGWPAAGMVQWGGIWGNSWILDPVRNICVVAYTNTMREGCNGPFRAEIRDAVYG
ncbi:MAG: beta-lactamase family protein [Devosia nanyangense]|uniref:Beta-lactamase family protein n=1 Tax=Devosia nanyangense TaxID=1228055 RepID=A0A933L523_9HYPH|nr:beta-lactamase family protein [Devosia nanyangense]